MNSSKYAAHISYFGTHYCGWQRQSGSDSGNLPSIQGTLESALLKMTGESVSVVGSGRTDAGVHAWGQVAHLRLSREWKTNVLQSGLNYYLPPDIRVLKVSRVSDAFHAQRSALKKQYSYYFQQGPVWLPSQLDRADWVWKKLDLGAMNAALLDLLGTHDFKVFQARGGSGTRKGEKDTVRTLLEVDVSICPEAAGSDGIFGSQMSDPEAVPYALIRLRVVGSGFLKQMVRAIAGTVRQVGEGRRSPSCFREIMERQDRALLGMTAPPQGLFLDRVWYDDAEGACFLL